MAKKKKRRIQTPSLSAFDKWIYYILIGCTFAICIATPVFILRYYRLGYFADGQVLAQNNHGAIPCMLYWVFLWIAATGFLGTQLGRKQPIFGKTGLKYGPPQWKPVYPLLSREFWRLYCQKKQRILRDGIIMILILLLTVPITLLLIPPRDQISGNGSISVFNCFNRCTQHYDASDVISVTIGTTDLHSRAGSNWSLEIKIVTQDGNVFWYAGNDFRKFDEDIDRSILGMLKLKSCFDSNVISVEDVDTLPKVIRDQSLREDEIELLYALFDRNPNE